MIQTTYEKLQFHQGFSSLFTKLCLAEQVQISTSRYTLDIIQDLRFTRALNKTKKHIMHCHYTENDIVIKIITLKMTVKGILVRAWNLIIRFYMSNLSI